MDIPIRDALLVSLHLILISALLGLVFFLGVVGKNLTSITQEKELVTETMLAYREMSFYDNTKVTGDDVLIAVKSYTQAYNIKIELGGVGNNVFIDLKKNDTLAKWSLDSVRADMNHNVSRGYRSTLTWDEYGMVSGITFKRED